MTMSKLAKFVAFSLTVVVGMAVQSPAQAGYFVRPVLQYDGELQDGYSNTLTSNSATFSDGFSSFASHVDLASGTIKTYLEMNGPSDGFGVSTGVMGDQIRYTGSSDEAVTFRFDFDSLISANQFYTGTPPDFESRYIGIQAHFAVYEAGSNATYLNWTELGTVSNEALYVGSRTMTFSDDPLEFGTFYADSLEADLFLTSGRSYDIFSAFNLIASPGQSAGSITMNSLNTSTIGITAPGGSFTSDSGEFLGFAQTPQISAVPEPATWATMIGGFGLVGAAMRRKRPIIRLA